MQCTFEEFVPGTDSDPEPARTFDEYLSAFRNNSLQAGKTLFGEGFSLKPQAVAKVEGDVFELIEAAALWNALAAWNRYMDTGQWESAVLTQPKGAVITPARKAAVVKLPRGYDTTKLFQKDVRAKIRAHEKGLEEHGLTLGLSSPDMVGIRIPDPCPPEFQPFLQPITNMGIENLERLEGVYQQIEGTLIGRSFLFAIAVKRTTRSDRLYQPLFEANVLKYLIEEVLRGAAFKFHVHMGSFAGADVVGHYSAASLLSLIRGGQPTRAIDSVFKTVSPAATAQVILDTLPTFPL